MLYYSRRKQFRGDTTYAANAVNLNKTDEWLGLQGATTRLDLGTKTLAWCGWVDWDGSSRHVLFEKGSTASASATNTFRAQVQTSGKVFLFYSDYDPGYIYQFWETTSSLSSGKNFITIYDDKSSKTRTVDIYVNGSSLGGGSWTEVGTFDSSTFNFTNSFNMHMGRTSKTGGGFDYKGTGAHFCGFAYDEELTLADHQYMYNNETPLCWDDMVTNNSTLTNKFDAYFDNATYNSRTELQARTDHVNGWILDNNGAAPFDNTYLSVECEV